MFIFKIARAVATHVLVQSEPLLQFQVSKKENNVVNFDIISKPEALDVENLKS
jgi:hypothetical protein